MPTREVFGNISAPEQALFFLLMTLCLALAALPALRRVRRPRATAPGAGRIHLCIFAGFVVLTIGTTLLSIHHLGPIRFHRGLYYLLYEATMDLFGVLMAAGLLLALVRRFAGRPRSLSHDATDVAMLA